ncbi:MAG: glucose-6-phosphate isomerase [Deltaproteobacteria bacterium]|jgi:glucose-6-phosphate isomerase|nr:glucose-6-phosphate isomerase [Deltaproteobacteria bacterium]
MAEKGSTGISTRSQISDYMTMDYNNLTAEALGGQGLSSGDLAEMKKALAAAYKDFEAKRRQGLLPFTELPSNSEIPKKCRKLADLLRKNIETVVVLGIGGSALGANAVFNALRPINHNALPPAKRQWPRLFIADNIDPEGFGVILDSLDPSKTFFNVISKSGATAETMSQFMVIHDMLQRSLGRTAIKDHLLITTDPQGGVLRKLVEANDYQSMEVPPGVGGRFTIFSAVGLAPLAMVGVSVYELLAGAKKAQQDFASPVLSNKALLFAGLNWLQTTVKGLETLVLMPYAEALSKVAEWFLQLWNESLGKALHLDGSPAGTGQTAIKAVGVTDQHSQLQMYMEGPLNKTVCFLGVEKFRSDVSIPKVFTEHDELSYLGGKTLGELLTFERLGTARALAENQRPNFTLTIPKVSAGAVGYILQTLMLATVISGTLYGVNPLDQPGVELSKKFTYGLMGRNGFSDMADRYHKGLSKKNKYVVK